ncbi:hypothetical protein [Comamonas sp. CMM02]|nr:hypothetical protein [Comamonas sp. CMM02]
MTVTLKLFKVIIQKIKAIDSEISLGKTTFSIPEMLVDLLA